MAIVVQILLPLISVVVAQGHNLDPIKPYVNHPHMGLHQFKDGPPKGPSNDRPINGDIFSYNTQHAYNHFYHDGDYNPGMNMYPYFGYPGPFGMGNFDNMGNLPYGIPGIHNEFNIPGHYRPNDMDMDIPNKNPADRPDYNPGNDKNSNEKPGREQPSQKDDKNPHQVAGQKIEDMPPKTNEVKDKDKEGKKDKVSLSANKDYLLVGNNGNGVYLLHENTPNYNVVVPNTNQPAGNNVIYVPYNPQQPPANPVYQIVNGQPPIANTPLTANRLDLNNYNNAVPSVQGNPQPNNGPSYVLIYANGQLIKIPGVVVNSQQNNAVLQNGNQGSNIIVPNNNVPMPNYVYANPQNQGNNPMIVQVPNGGVVSNNIPNNGVFVQNPQNPNNIPSNNIVYSNNPPITMPQPSPQPNVYAQPNMGNGYVQPSVGNQGPIVNTFNPNAQGSNSNQGLQPALALPTNNNPNMYQPVPSQEKEANAVTPQNDIPAPNPQPQNPQPAIQPPDVSGGLDITNTLGAQPALMVSGFKETSTDDKDKKKDKKEKKEKTKDKKKK